MSATAVDLGRPELERRASTRAEGLFSWGGAIGLLVLVVWAVPIKSYRLPVALPFSLELYRLLLIVLVGAWLVAIVTGTRQVSAGGLGKPLALLAAVGVISIVANTNALSGAGLESQAIKSLSYFLSFLLAYLLVCSTIETLPAAELVVQALVLGAAAISIAAIYEARTNYDVFDHLHKWISFLEPTRAIKESARRGTRLRVHASAQHPIALGAALTMAMPLAAYLATRARNSATAFFWGAAGVLCVVGALTTVSRTVVSMAIAMTIVALLVRKQVIVRFWPLGIVLLVAVHLAAPHTLGSLYHSFLPKGGLVQSQTAARRQRRLGPRGRHRARPAELEAGAGLRARPRHGQGGALERARRDRRPEDRRADHLRRPVPELARLDRLRRPDRRALVRLGRRAPDGHDRAAVHRPRE